MCSRKRRPSFTPDTAEIRCSFNAGTVTPSDFVRLTSTSVAKAFNLFPRKGALAAGSDADIIILNPKAQHTISASSHHSRIDTNIYEGREVTGKVRVPVFSFNQGASARSVLPIRPQQPMLQTYGRVDRLLQTQAASPISV